MAKSQALKLSALKQNVDYPVANKLVDKRCLIHVKLTESCLGAIEGLMNSDKGAFFSLWFEGTGGTITIPVSGGDSRKYEFSTGVDPVQKGERHGGLECVHQEMDPTRNQQLTCLGPMEYKLTVKANDDTYDRTVKLMRQAEEDRNKTKAQEIQVPNSRQHKKKMSCPTSMGVRKPTGPKPQSSISLKPRSPTMPNSSRNPRTLKERITYLLAIKPLRRADIVVRLKKDTKRSESAMSNLDSILADVCDGASPEGYFRLKASLFAELQIDDWPFYSEAERQLVRRNLSLKAEPRSDSPSPPKRPFSTTHSSGRPAESVPKRLKVSHTPPSTLAPALQEASSLPPTRPTSSPAPFSRLPSSTLLAPVTVTTAPTATILRSESAVLSSTTGQLLSACGVGVARPASTNRTPVPSAQQRVPPPPTSTEPAQQLKPAAVETGGDHTGGPNSQSHSVGVAPSNVLSVGGSQTQSDIVTSHSHKAKKRKKNKHGSIDKMDRQSETIVPQNPSHLSSSVVTNSVTVSNKEPVAAVPARVNQGDPENQGAACAVPSSTTNGPDMLSQYPPITSDRQRTEYKCTFNKDYDEYLKIKDSLDAMTKEWQGLGTRLSQLQKHSEEAKELRKKIRKRYTELQQDHKYTEQKRRHEELHYKLSHIKQLIVDYDSRP